MSQRKRRGHSFGGKHLVFTRSSLVVEACGNACGRVETRLKTANSDLKGKYGLRRPPVRGRDRMALFMDLVMLARLSAALARMREQATIAA
jgi:hypothetical protein